MSGWQINTTTMEFTVKDHWRKVRQFDLLRRFRWFVQRGRRGYSDRDLWSLDWYLLDWLPEALETLGKNTHGYPADSTAEEWEAVLLKIADGLREARKAIDFCDDTYSGAEREEILNTKFTETWELLGERFFDLWD